MEKELLEDAIDRHILPEETQGKLMYMEMIAELDAVDREIVSLKIIAGLTHHEIAKLLHRTTGSVKKRYERALNKIKANYKEA